MLNARDIAQRILDMHPEPKAVTLHAVLPEASLDAGVAWQCIRKSADRELLMLTGIAGVEHKVLQLVQIDQATAPVPGYRITDWNGAVWFIKHVDVKMGDRVHDCLLTKTV